VEVRKNLHGTRETTEKTPRFLRTFEPGVGGSNPPGRTMKSTYRSRTNPAPNGDPLGLLLCSEAAVEFTPAASSVERAYAPHGLDRLILAVHIEVQT
jgi:hypothetical protein